MVLDHLGILNGEGFFAIAIEAVGLSAFWFGDDFDFFGDHEGAIEANTELTDDR